MADLHFHVIKFRILHVYLHLFKVIRPLAYVVFGLVLGCTKSEAQSRYDSLKGIYSRSEGQVRSEVAFELFKETVDKDNEEAVTYAGEAYRLAQQTNDSLFMVRTGRAYGYVLGKLGNNRETIQIFRKILGIAERNRYDVQVKFLLNNIALSYTYEAVYDKALEYHFRSLILREASGDKGEISITKNNIGFVYYKLKDFEKALEYYQQALAIKREIKDPYDMDRTLINIALCYQQLKHYDLVPGYIDEAFKVCQPTCTEVTLMEGYIVLGNAYLMMKDLARAESNFRQSYDIANRLKEVRFLAESLQGFGGINKQAGKLDLSLDYLKQAEAVLDSTNYREDQIRIYKSLADVYNEQRNFEQASNYQGKYIQLKDSVYSEALIKNLARVQTDYEERENIKTIAEKDENLRLKEEVIVRQRQVYFFIAAVAMLSIALAFAFFIYNRAISKAKADLAMLNETLEQRVAERTKALQSVNNELDNFIYKTSHDIRGPLASLKGIANVALLELDDPKAKDYLRKLDNSADKLNSILTRLLIVNQINHAVLAPQAINFAELIEEILVFERKKGIPNNMNISYEIADGVELVTDRHLLRIVLENLIDNAIKYYNSSARIEPFVKIKVVHAGEEVLVKVIDNGIGIQERDPQKLFQMFVRASERSESGGIGLYLTKLATERLEAKVDFATTSDKFTQFSVRLPPNLVHVLQAKGKPLV